MSDLIGQQREIVEGKMWERSGMQVAGRLGGVVRSYSRGLLS